MIAKFPMFAMDALRDEMSFSRAFHGPYTAFLCGCDDGREAERRDSYGVKPIMVIYGKDAGRGYFYYALHSVFVFVFVFIWV